MRLGSLTRAVMDFIFPATCAVCGAGGDGTSPLCEKCLSQLDGLIGAPRCRRCARPSAYEGSPCPFCKGDGIKPFERIVNLARFDEPVRSLIHAVKYHRAWPLAEYLAERLLARKEAAELLAESDVLVPVPLHRLRYLTRGYNQAAVIAERVRKPSRIKLSDALIRVRHTETQTHLHSNAKRHANLLDAFALARERDVRGKRVVLVDDVTTSGATLHEAAKAVRRGRPASVSALVIAVADSKGGGFQSV